VQQAAQVGHIRERVFLARSQKLSKNGSTPATHGSGDEQRILA
jgi:hypothetical protein